MLSCNLEVNQMGDLNGQLKELTADEPVLENLNLTLKHTEKTKLPEDTRALALEILQKCPLLRSGHAIGYHISDHSGQPVSMTSNAVSEALKLSKLLPCHHI